MNANGLLVSIAGLMFLAGCSLAGDDDNAGDDDSDIIVERVQVHDIEVASRTERSVTFEVTASWPNSCGEFARFDMSREGMSYWIEMYGQQPENAGCFQAITPITGEWETQVAASGTYLFQFRAGPRATKDTTLTFE